MPQKPTSVEIAALIARLLSHYWTGEDRIETRQAQIEDWIEDLIEFDLAAVAEACQQWRRTERRRPAPAEIRKLAAEEQWRIAYRARPRLAAPAEKPGEPEKAITPEEREWMRGKLAELAGWLRGGCNRPEKLWTQEALRAERVALGLGE